MIIKHEKMFLEIHEFIRGLQGSGKISGSTHTRIHDFIFHLEWAHIIPPSSIHKYETMQVGTEYDNVVFRWQEHRIEISQNPHSGSYWIDIDRKLISADHASYYADKLSIFMNEKGLVAVV